MATQQHRQLQAVPARPVRDDAPAPSSPGSSLMQAPPARAIRGGEGASVDARAASSRPSADLVALLIASPTADGGYRPFEPSQGLPRLSPHLGQSPVLLSPGRRVGGSRRAKSSSAASSEPPAQRRRRRRHRDEPCRRRGGESAVYSSPSAAAADGFLGPDDDSMKPSLPGSLSSSPAQEGTEPSPEAIATAFTPLRQGGTIKRTKELMERVALVKAQFRARQLAAANGPVRHE